MCEDILISELKENCSRLLNGEELKNSERWPANPWPDNEYFMLLHRREIKNDTLEKLLNIKVDGIVIEKVFDSEWGYCTVKVSKVESKSRDNLIGELSEIADAYLNNNCDEKESECYNNPKYKTLYIKETNKHAELVIGRRRKVIARRIFNDSEENIKFMRELRKYYKLHNGGDVYENENIFVRFFGGSLSDPLTDEIFISVKLPLQC